LLGATAFPGVDSMKVLGSYVYCIQFMNRRLFELVSFGSNFAGVSIIHSFLDGGAVGSAVIVW
jgi:hypothetical protein